MQLNQNSLNPAMFGIPCPHEANYTYVASGTADDDDIETITYKNADGNTIGVLTITYVGGNTNNILRIVRTT
jgi:hypothetical protein